MENCEFSREEYQNIQNMVSFIADNTSLFINEPSEQNFNLIMERTIQNRYWLAPLWIFPTSLERSYTQYVIRAYKILRQCVPKEKQYDLFCEYYVTSGFDFPKYLINEVKKFRPKDYLKELPEECQYMNTLTIYRASEVSPLEAYDTLINADEIAKGYSWTISPTVAMKHYLMRKDIGEKRYLYQGNIDRKDVIAYLSPNAQQEILQYDKVSNIQPINVNRLVELCNYEEEIGLLSAQYLDWYKCYVLGKRYDSITGKPYYVSVE